MVKEISEKAREIVRDKLLIAFLLKEEPKPLIPSMGN
jgi:hypothetical protein